MDTAQPPALVNVVVHPQLVRFFVRLRPGCVLPFSFEHSQWFPEWIRLSKNPQHPDGPVKLRLWFCEPPTDHETTENTSGSHTFDVYPHTPEGAAALAVLGFGPDLQRIVDNTLN